ncbi:MAG: phosphatase PAP2 family protein, partial [Bacteroidota bacterium]
MLEALVQWDKEVFVYLNNLGTPAWDGFWLVVTNKYYAIPVYVIFLVLLFKKLGLKQTLACLVAIALLITATDQLANFFKYGVGRLRPCHDLELEGMFRLVKASCGGKFSYFSAHAANAMALSFFVITLLSGKLTAGWRMLILVWAMLVAYSRIYLGVHFPLDVLTGIFIGAFFGWLFAKLSIFAFEKIGV